MYFYSFLKYADYFLVCNHRAQSMQYSLSPLYKLSLMNKVIVQHSEVINQKYCFKIITKKKNTLWIFLIISFHGQSCGLVDCTHARSVGSGKTTRPLSLTAIFCYIFSVLLIKANKNKNSLVVDFHTN